MQASRHQRQGRCGLDHKVFKHVLVCLCVCFEDVLACMIKTVNLNRKNLTKKKRRTSYKSMQVRETT